MDQTEAMIAALRAQVQKERAAKEAAHKKEEEKTAATGKSSSGGSSKPQYRTISPEEMAKLEEKKRMKAAGLDMGVTGGIKDGPTLANPLGNGPTLSNPSAGTETLLNSGLKETGLGIEITEPVKLNNADESTITLNTDQINAAVEKSKETSVLQENLWSSQEQQFGINGGGLNSGGLNSSGTIVLNDEDSLWGSDKKEKSGFSLQSDDSGFLFVEARDETKKADDVISIIPVKNGSENGNNVKSVYNIDFDDDDDFMSFNSSKAAEDEAGKKAEEEARRKAEEEARRKAEEEARRKAEEEARRKAEEEARRKAEEEARRKAEEEARRKAEEEARRRAEEEARRKAEEETRKRIEEETRRRIEEETRRRIEEETKRIEEEARKKIEEEIRRQTEEASRQNGTSTSRGDYVLPVGAEQFLGKYLSVSAISDQIIQAMRYISENPSSPRNIVILGQYGFGTTTIAEDFARSFYAMGICKKKTIAKIKGGPLNRANLGDITGKLQGGCLVIENAGVLSSEKLDEMYRIVSDPSNDIVIIMTGQIQNLSKIFKDNVVISSQFKHMIQVHRITDMDVFTIAKNYAEKLGYPCESAAESQLRRRMQEVESGNLDRVLKFVDNAVSKAHNREMATGEQEHHLLPTDFE